MCYLLPTTEPPCCHIELKLGTEYEMTVRAINKLGESAFQKGTVMAKTLGKKLTFNDGLYKIVV